MGNVTVSARKQEGDSLISFLIKLVVFPLVIILSAYLFPNVNYVTLFDPIIIGIILAGAGNMLEYAFLNEETLWLSTGIDFVASVLLVYFISLFFVDSRVTFFGAILTGFIVAVTEHFTHLWLIRSGRTKKSTVS
jgi:uncharacterized membrane protein